MARAIGHRVMALLPELLKLDMRFLLHDILQLCV